MRSEIVKFGKRADGKRVPRLGGVCNRLDVATDQVSCLVHTDVACANDKKTVSVGTPLVDVAKLTVLRGKVSAGRQSIDGG